MEIEVGSIIKIICINNVIEGGKLLEYNENQMVLELFDRSLFIVQDPLKNIIAIKVDPPAKTSRKPEQVFVEEELKPDRYYPQEELRAKSLAELHKLRANEERERARDLLTSKKIEAVPEAQFGYPVFSKSVFKYPTKKTR